jgi:TctA family transporter
MVLGEIAEVNLHISMQIWGVAFLTRPITLILLALTVLSVVYPLWQQWRKRQAGAAK